MRAPFVLPISSSLTWSFYLCLVSNASSSLWNFLQPPIVLKTGIEYPVLWPQCSVGSGRCSVTGSSEQEEESSRAVQSEDSLINWISTIEASPHGMQLVIWLRGWFLNYRNVCLCIRLFSLFILDWRSWNGECTDDKVDPGLNSLSTAPLRCMGSEGIAPLFLTSALDENEWSALRPCLLTPGK
jgi:hypothetical protein